MLPFFALSFWALNLYTFLTGAFFAELCVFVSLTPVNSAIMWTQPEPRLRPLALAISTMTIHLLGDAASPTLIGVRPSSALCLTLERDRCAVPGNVGLAVTRLASDVPPDDHLARCRVRLLASRTLVRPRVPERHCRPSP